jgi:putative copper export protein
VVAVAGPLAVLSVLVTAVSTNPATLTGDRVLDLVAIQAHIQFGALWLGGLTGLALLVRTRGRLGEGAGLRWARIWQRFGVVALVSVGGVVASGAVLTWRHVGTVDQLLSTQYGRFLLVKLLLVVVLVAAGGYNQFVLGPRIARVHAAGDSAEGWRLTLRHFPVVVTVEALVGAGVLLVVPFLSGSARSQAGDAAAGFDGRMLLLAALLVLGLAGSLVTTHRVAARLATAR